MGKTTKETTKIQQVWRPEHRRSILNALSQTGKKMTSFIAPCKSEPVFKDFCNRAVRKLGLWPKDVFSDIIRFLDLYGLINARVISKGRYGLARDITGSLTSEVLRKLLAGQSNDPFGMVGFYSFVRASIWTSNYNSLQRIGNSVSIAEINTFKKGYFRKSEKWSVK